MAPVDESSDCKREATSHGHDLEAGLNSPAHIASRPVRTLTLPIIAYLLSLIWRCSTRTGTPRSLREAGAAECKLF
jgi:hypothetical protein